MSLFLVSVCLYDSLCVLLVTLCDLGDYNVGSVAGSTYTNDMAIHRLYKSKRLRIGGSVRLQITYKNTREETD